jgi:Tol biopolymer transport system component
MKKKIAQSLISYFTLTILSFIVLSNCSVRNSTIQGISLTSTQPFTTHSISESILTTQVSATNTVIKKMIPTNTQNILPSSTSEDKKTLFPEYMQIAYLIQGSDIATMEKGRVIIVDLYGQPKKKLILDCLFCDSISWSPDGQYLAYAASNDRNLTGDHIYTIRVVDGKITPILYSYQFAYNVTWFPDGKGLTYVADTETSDLINLILKTGGLEKLTTTHGMESNPAWSPDGKKIAFIYRVSRSAPGELWIMDEEKINRQKIVEIPVGISNISWSPDGKQIAFSSEGHCSFISTVDLESHIVTKVTDTDLCASNPVWSPDGNSIAFIGIHYDPPDTAWFENWGIYLINASGGEIIPILQTNEGTPSSLAWSPVPRLVIGKTYAVTDMGADLNVRESASLFSKVILKLESGDKINVTAGPAQADGYYWWQVSCENGLQGWIAEVSGWFRPIQ